MRCTKRIFGKMYTSYHVSRSNFPNDSFDFRMVQYLKMIPTSDREFMPAMKLERFDTCDWYECLGLERREIVLMWY